MDSDKLSIMGTASQVAELFSEVEVRSIYGPEAAKLYDIVNRHDTLEIDELLDAAKGREGPVLELGCGTGRLTFPFLGRGYDVTALDLSPDMLEVLEERLDEPQNRRFAEHVRLVQSNVSDFGLGRRFDLIVAGGATILAVNGAERRSMFERVREHLSDDGRFLITLIEFEVADDAPSTFENVVTFTVRDEVSDLLCVLYDYLAPADGVRSVTVLAHRVKNGAVSDTMLFNGVSKMLPLQVVEEEIKAAGLRVIARHDISGEGSSASPLRAHLRQRRPLLEVGL